MWLISRNWSGFFSDKRTHFVKIRAKDTERQPILNVTEIFHGKIVDVTNDSMVIELTGHQDKLEAFLDLLQGYDNWS